MAGYPANSVSGATLILRPHLKLQARTPNAFGRFIILNVPCALELNHTYYLLVVHYLSMTISSRVEEQIFF